MKTVNFTGYHLEMRLLTSTHLYSWVDGDYDEDSFLLNETMPWQGEVRPLAVGTSTTLMICKVSIDNVKLGWFHVRCLLFIFFPARACPRKLQPFSWTTVMASPSSRLLCGHSSKDRTGKKILSSKMCLFTSSKSCSVSISCRKICNHLLLFWEDFVPNSAMFLYAARLVDSNRGHYSSQIIWIILIKRYEVSYHGWYIYCLIWRQISAVKFFTREMIKW